MKLTQRQRALIGTFGIPAGQVATAMGMTVIEVLEMRSQLKAMGLMPQDPANAERRRGGQLAFDVDEDRDDLDRLMRSNRAPRPASAELEHTTTTDLEGW